MNGVGGFERIQLIAVMECSSTHSRTLIHTHTARAFRVLFHLWKSCDLNFALFLWLHSKMKFSLEIFSIVKSLSPVTFHRHRIARINAVQHYELTRCTRGNDYDMGILSGLSVVAMLEKRKCLL